MSNVFITSASGNIGTELVPLLIQSDAVKTLILPTSNAARLEASVPPSDKIAIIQGSIQDPSWLEPQLSRPGDRHRLPEPDRHGRTLHHDELPLLRPALRHRQAPRLPVRVRRLPRARIRHTTVLRTCLAAHVVVKVIAEQALAATRARSEARGFSWTNHWADPFHGERQVGQGGHDGVGILPRADWHGGGE